MTYTIIQCITNDYDKVFDCYDTDANERLLFTDKNTLAKNWKVNLIEPHKDFPFDDIFKIRWNPFEYTDSDYVVWIDGSIKINGSIKKYVDKMIKGNFDFACLSHFARKDVFSEYQEWCKIRNYKKEKAFMWLYHFQECGLDIKNSGLYQPGIMIFKNNEIVKNFCNDMNKELHYLDNEHYERLDQTIMTMLLKTKYKNLNLLILSYTTYRTNELKFVGKHPDR